MSKELSHRDQHKVDGLSIYQPALIAYRSDFFADLDRALEGRLRVLAGVQSREASVTTTDTSASWLCVVKNRWLWGRRLLFQSGEFYSALWGENLVLTLNPRFIHNWIHLTIRALLRKPTILWGHLYSRGGAGSWTNLLRLLQVRLGSVFLVYTELEKRQFSELGVDRICVALGNSCVRREHCTPALSQVAKRPSGILYVGRIDQSKKVGLLVEAFAIIAAQNLSQKLVIVGDGDERVGLEARFSSLVEQGRLIFKGWVWDESELRSCYENALYTVSPGYGGLNIIQSFAYGVPIAVPRGENHSPEIEACVEGENSLWFDKEDAESLARLMVRFEKEGDFWYARRAELSARTRDRYTIERMVDQFDNGLSQMESQKLKLTAGSVL